MEDRGETFGDIRRELPPDAQFSDGVRTIPIAGVPDDAPVMRDGGIVLVRVPAEHHTRRSQGWVSFAGGGSRSGKVEWYTEGGESPSLCPGDVGARDSF